MPIVPLQEGLRELSLRKSEKPFEEYRLQRLKETVEYASKKSPWYQKRLTVKSDEINCLGDITKLPFTEPGDLARGEYEFLCVSRSELEKYTSFVSSGTTGPRKSVYFSHADVEAITDFLGVGMRTAAPEGSVIQIFLPNSPVRGMGNLLIEGVEKQGMRGYLSDIFQPLEEHIRLCIENHPYLWFGDTRLIYRITKEMEKKYDLRSLGVKVMFTTISDISNTMRQMIEEAWNCRVMTHYGLTEMGFGLAVDCPMGCGYHYNEFGVIAEAVDPESGESLPDGVEGELVYTSLGREAMPLIRYRSHDIAAIKRGPCKCGARLSTISHVKRRQEAVVEYLGTKLYPTLFDDAVFANSHVIDYELYLNKKDGVMRFEVECIDAPNHYEKTIYERLKSHPALKNLKSEVKLLPLHTLVGGAHFKKLIHIEG